MGESDISRDGEFQELARLLEEAGSPLKCLRCGTQPLQLLDDPARHARTGVPVWMSRGFNVALGGPPTQRLDTLTVVCPACGHVEQFAEEILRRKAQSRNA